MDQYVYTPLSNPRQIRILRLKPAVLGNQLRCSLEVVSLDGHQTIGYDAISYVCGPEDPDRTIICDGKELLIRPNCEVALKRFRRQTGSRRLWVDAICINQSKAEEGLREREIQIQLMSEIFGSANMVLLWLGQGNTVAAETALKYVARIAELDSQRHSTDPSHSERRRTLLKDTVVNMKREQLTLVENHMDEDSTLLSMLFRRVWFHRMWTIQELVLSPNAILVCGIYSVTWVGLREALEIIGIFDRSLLGPETVRNNLLLNGLRDEIERGHRPRLPDTDFIQRTLDQLDRVNEYRLFRSLRSLCNRGSKELVDRLFALYGLFKAINVTLPAPSYSRPLGEVFREASVAIIQQRKSLTPLILGAGAHSIEGLPSWAVDWTFSAPGILPDIFPAVDCWKATPGETSEFQFSQDGRKLRVKGKVIDRVQNCAVVFPWDTDSSTVDYIFSIRAFIKWLQVAATFVSPTQDTSLVFWTTVQAPSGAVDIDRNGLDLDMDAVRDWLAIVLDMTTCHEEGLKQVDITSLRQDLRDTWPSNLDPEDDFNKFPDDDEIRRMTHLAHHRNALSHHTHQTFMARGTSFFTTAAGSMGRTQRKCENGDVIALVAGVDFPLMLRVAEDKEFILQGPAYVNGVMLGEVCPEGKEDWDQLTLI